MLNISVKLIKKLREITGASIIECKKALISTEGNIEKAIEKIKIYSNEKAKIKSLKIVSQGVIKSYCNNHNGILLEINAETDFAIKDKIFKDFAEETVKAACYSHAKTIEDILSAKISSSKTIDEARKLLILKIGENIRINRIKNITGNILGVYNHNNKIGAIVSLNKGDITLARDIAMHIVAMNPIYISSKQIPSYIINKKRNFFICQAKLSNKYALVDHKIINSKLNKFIDEITLLNQNFIKNSDIKIKELINDKDIKIVDFIRLGINDNI